MTDETTRHCVDVNHGDHGTTHATLQPGQPMFGSVEVGEFVDETSSVTVHGYAHDDEPGQVSARVSVGAITVTLSCSPARARELAAELETAANHADE